MLNTLRIKPSNPSNSLAVNETICHEALISLDSPICSISPYLLTRSWQVEESIRFD